MLLGKIKKLGVRKQHEEQIVEIEKFLAIAPQNPDQNMNLARAFEATERLSSAAWAYQTVVDIDPKNLGATIVTAHGEERYGDSECIRCGDCVEACRMIFVGRPGETPPLRFGRVQPEERSEQGAPVDS